MSFKGFLAVSLFLSSMLAVSGTVQSSSIDWNHSAVVSGGTVNVKVLGATCHPVTVTLFVNGHAIVGTITEVPGECNLKVPDGVGGLGYILEVRCPSDVDVKIGQVL